jgi:hypothetical protein
MNALFNSLALTAALTAALLAPEAAAAARHPNRPDSVLRAAKAADQARTMESRLEYRFFQNYNRRKRYTLALQRTPTEHAEVRLLAENGAQLYRAEIDGTSLVRHFDLRRVAAGTYTLQIVFGSQLREEAIVLE